MGMTIRKEGSEDEAAAVTSAFRLRARWFRTRVGVGHRPFRFLTIFLDALVVLAVRVVRAAVGRAAVGRAAAGRAAVGRAAARGAVMVGRATLVLGARDGDVQELIEPGGSEPGVGGLAVGVGASQFSALCFHASSRGTVVSAPPYYLFCHYLRNRAWHSHRRQNRPHLAESHAGVEQQRSTHFLLSFTVMFQN